MKGTKKKKLGEVLRERGKISQEDLSNVIADQHGKLIYLGEILLERGLVAKADIIAALQEVSRFPYIDCTNAVVEPGALSAIPEAMAERCLALPIRYEGNKLVMALADPQDLAKLEELRFTAGCEILPRLSFRTELRAAIQNKYHPGQAAAAQTDADTAWEELQFLSTSARESSKEAVQEIQAELRQGKTPAVQAVSEIIQLALQKRASDIHIEPRAGETEVRIRVDGVLRDLRSISRSLQNSIVSRVKIISDMDIGERRAPQDGRFMVTMGIRQVDVRVSTLPTQYGEKVVMRLLESGSQKLSLSDLGVSPEVAGPLTELLSMPQGMILVTGPTGSGKSTTLYSALAMLRNPSVNIVTVEDPIEYILPGINQSHVNTRAGLTFASCLRSILRQDPNIIMVGEIRDAETAEIAMKAAQTGHLVLSTLHTNDSISAVSRLLDLGIPAFLIGSSITGVLAQRLLRKLCSCHVFRPATPEFLARLALAGVNDPPGKIAVPVGCEKCDGVGYKGRVGIYELLSLGEDIRSIVRAGGSADEIRSMARSHGLRTMQDDALAKLRAGVTTLEEILRVLSLDTSSRLVCLKCGQPTTASVRFCSSCGASLTEMSDLRARGSEILA